MHGGKVHHALLTQFFNQFVHSEAGTAHLILQDVAFLNNNGGTAADQVPEADAFQVQYRNHHRQRQQCQDRKDTVDQWDAEILHWNSSQIRDQQCQHQFGRFQFTDLAFAHEPQAGHDQEIKNDRSDQRSQHADNTSAFSICSCAGLYAAGRLCHTYHWAEEQ